MAVVGLFTALGASACRGGIPAASAGVPARANSVPRNGLEVVGAVRRAHPSRELRSLAFTIAAVRYSDDDSSRVRARAHALLPGRMRIGELPASRRTGDVRDRQGFARFVRGRRVTTTRTVDLATLLVYDLFAQSIDSTVAWLDTARVRVGLLRVDELDGRRTLVVGAAAGDSTTTQFWVDADAWRIVRVIQPDPHDPRRVEDIRFPTDTTVLGVPLPTTALEFRGGRLVERREMSRFVANPGVPSRAFDLRRWRPLND